MLKSKSFTLSSNTDKNQKGRDLLYEPRRIRWNRYLIAISLIGFSLLLILSNVNFSGDSYEMVVVPLIEIENQTAEVGTSTTSDSPGTITTVGGDTTEEGQSVGELGEDREEQEEKGSAVIGVLNIETAAAQIPITSFTCDDNRTCQTITCTGQPVNSIAIEQEFEYFIRYCGNKYFDVIIENCVFQKNTIDAYMFSGSFRLNTLTIRNCQLQTIADSAFDQTTMHKLLNLTFEGVQLKSLSEKTFSGLGTVQNFTLINQQQTANATLTASNFLQPMAVNLSMVILQQIQEQCNCQTIYNPTDWLGDDSDTLYAQLLFVDLSGTNFNHTLNNRTFSNLVAVQQLRLANCTLSVIGENVFTAIVQTLQYLDLRGNNLQRLDGEFLALATLNNVTIGMSSNLWRCCENTDLVYYLQQVEDQYARDVVCATPVELQGVQIRYAELNCSGLASTTNTNSLTKTSAMTVKPTATTVAMPTTATKTTTTDTTTTTVITITTNKPTITTTGMSKTTATMEIQRTPNITTTSTDTIATTIEMPKATTTTTQHTTATPITEATMITTIKPTTQNTTEAVIITTEITISEMETPKTTTTEPMTKTTALTAKATTTISTTRNTKTTAPTITEPMTRTTFQTIFPNSTIPTSPLTTIVSPLDMISTSTATTNMVTTTPWITATPSPSPNTTIINTETTTEVTLNTTIASTPPTTTMPTTTEKVETTAPNTPDTTIYETTAITIVSMPPIATSTSAPKTTVTTITTSTRPTTVSPTGQCYQNKSTKFLVCSHIIAVSLCDYDVPFNVTTISPKSVELRIGSNASSFEVIYFPALNYRNYQALAVGNSTTIDIDYLTSNQSYVFCLLPIGIITTSPFNCRAAYLPPAVPKSWLNYNDRAVFFTISILITLLCVAVGVATVYFLLRWRPTLMYGSKRLRRLASTSHEVLLFPKRERTSLDSQTYAMNELSNMPSSISDTLTPENCLNIKSYDYMQYFKNHELNKKQTNVAYISYIRPPDNRAPALPPEARGVYIPVRQLSQQSTVILENEPKPLKSCLRSGSRLPSNGKAVEFENEYESLDYYQEIY